MNDRRRKRYWSKLGTGVYIALLFLASFGIATVFLDGLGLGGGTVSWLEGSRSAMVIAVVATAWRSAPLLAIILLAALRGIPRSLYRAARMDGAGGFASFRFVTLPALQNTLIIVTILQIVISLQVFDVIYSLTGGGPGGETTVITYYIWERAFQNLSFGYSAALAVFLFFVTLACALALILFRLRSGRGERERTA